MNAVLKLVISLSISGSLLLLLLLFARKFYRSKLSRQWQYYIWLVVIARLLLPLAPETSLMTMAAQAFEQLPMQLEADIAAAPQSEDSDKGKAGCNYEI